ncbi:DUF1146 family protein [Streptococcus infantarius]|jgi:uncharacterized integral membrane protein (TIGR02327 family)|uniref:Membrane protein n=2 Tax=Streptococcus infantarius TaxID=102684 RepID=A0A380KL99_9STRE|nr:DUF1146 family protein [Streptococcus infantarius]MBK8155912.1 DUF1146 domain-containing protein [Streptococcus sp.]EDT47176.1 putative membrane protein [Streptococcus infantarius subsp. infantarius ATCC BAA-102]MBT0896990.1 DUF1146 family protein [Streptococcus infantarius subsp. infantarius]MBT0900173.1 DUF1146 family protein [Streptococcus infantarius subsp. infantarius]MBT1033810.1 DUF1146 family protein [Streptococcus infantarius subsp. infantarius]
MEILNSSVTLISHLVFIAMTHQILRNLFDWSKLIKNTSENIGRLKVFILLVSIALGYMVSHFILEIITVSQTFFFGFQ